MPSQCTIVLVWALILDVLLFDSVNKTNPLKSVNMKPIFLIQRTAVYDNADGGCCFEKRFNIHRRINHKASDQRHYHISNVGYDFRQDWTREQKQNDYKLRCLENGKRPFNYPDNLWNEYLNEVAQEEHSNKCEARNAWRYEI